MDRRKDLQARFEELLGSKNVYFQPPQSRHLEYPCIIYRRGNADTRFGNNMPYTFTRQYDVTYITRNPDDPFIETLAHAFQMIQHDRFYTADNLNHDVFTLYY